MAVGDIRLTINLGTSNPARVGPPSTVVVAPAPKILSVR